jgi:hypothetical protein
LHRYEPVDQPKYYAHNNQHHDYVYQRHELATSLLVK